MSNINWPLAVKQLLIFKQERLKWFTLRGLIEFQLTLGCNQYNIASILYSLQDNNAMEYTNIVKAERNQSLPYCYLQKY